jgi:uncharacterized protein (AIM24 family)
MVGARPGHHLRCLELAGEVLFVREGYLLAFSLGGLTYESGKLSLGDGESTAVLQLRGRGHCVLELLEPLVSVAVSASSRLCVRRETLVGWIGRLIPRALLPAESPSDQRGLVSFSGEGAVLLAQR